MVIYSIKTAVFIGEESVDAFVVDRDFNLVDTYKEQLPKKSEMTYGKVKDVLFPFVTSFDSPSSLFIGIYSSMATTFYWMIISLILTIITLVMLLRQNKSIKNNLLDLLLVLGQEYSDLLLFICSIIRNTKKSNYIGPKGPIYSFSICI